MQLRFAACVAWPLRTHGPFKASQPIPELPWWNWISLICFWIPKTLTAFAVVRALPPTSPAQPLWWLRWHIALDHQSKVTKPCSAPPILIQSQLRPPLPLQPLSSPRPLLIPQSHQARFPEDAISTTSTHRAGALCSRRARRAIDQVRHLLAGSSSPPPCFAIFSLPPASPPAASHHSR